MTSNSDSFYIMMNRRFGDFPNDGLILLTNLLLSLDPLLSLHIFCKISAQAVAVWAI